MTGVEPASLHSAASSEYFIIWLLWAACTPSSGLMSGPVWAAANQSTIDLWFNCSCVPSYFNHHLQKRVLISLANYRIVCSHSPCLTNCINSHQMWDCCCCSWRPWRNCTWYQKCPWGSEVLHDDRTYRLWCARWGSLLLCSTFFHFFFNYSYSNAHLDPMAAKSSSPLRIYSGIKPDDDCSWRWIAVLNRPFSLWATKHDSSVREIYLH